MDTKKNLEYVQDYDDDRYDDWEREDVEQEELTWNQRLWEDIGYSNCY
jgi:hypothetical protein